MTGIGNPFDKPFPPMLVGFVAATWIVVIVALKAGF